MCGGVFSLKRLLDFDVGLVVLYVLDFFYTCLRYELINVSTEVAAGKWLISLQVLPWMEVYWLRQGEPLACNRFYDLTEGSEQEQS